MLDKRERNDNLMRKELKKNARGRLKKTYWMMVILCLFMAAVGLDYGTSLEGITGKQGDDSVSGIVITQILEGNADQSVDVTDEYIEDNQEISDHYGILALDHSKGIFAGIVNSAGSGQLFYKLYTALKTAAGTKNLAITLFVIIALAFLLAVYFLIYKPLEVVISRAVLEMRQYDKYPIKRMLYLISIRKYWNVVATQFLRAVYTLLWSLTIVGIFIKSFSYMMVPYILAENPAVPPKEAITLSRKMMDGHKWEACKLLLSFFGWWVLTAITFGLVGIFYANPYQEMTFAEYYKYVRSDAKSKLVLGTDYLDDKYLFEIADDELLDQYYKDVQANLKEAEGDYPKHTGLRKFFENTLGLILFYDEDEAQYQKKKAIRLALKDYKCVMKKEMYPFRLFMHNHKEDVVKLASVQYQRHYSIFNVILIFFSTSFIGWCYEVSLHLVNDGVFVNRGVYHGPWLPIYGYGGVMILLILYKLREKPIAEFVSAVVLCGCVEYFTSWYLQVTHDGMKWWDYHGYFLNLNGRVCGEGLLVFGLGGLAIVYLLAPALDNIFRRIPRKIVVVLVVVLLAIYIADIVYSHYYPNMGAGITDYAVQTLEHVDTAFASLEVL